MGYRFPIVDSRVESEVCPLFFQLGTGDALRYAFELGGFTDIRIERLSTILEYETAEDACGAAFAGGPVALAYSRFDERTRDTWGIRHRARPGGEMTALWPR